MTNVTTIKTTDLLQLKYAFINALDLISKLESTQQKPISEKQKSQEQRMQERMKSIKKNKN